MRWRASAVGLLAVLLVSLPALPVAAQTAPWWCSLPFIDPRWYPECRTDVTPTPVAMTPTATSIVVPTPTLARTPLPIPAPMTATPLPEQAPVPPPAGWPWFCNDEAFAVLFPGQCPVIVRATPTPAGTATNTPMPEPTGDARTYPREVLRLLNEIRAENGLGLLRWDERLGRAASAYAKHLSDTSCFSHECPSGYTVGDRADEVGYPFTMAGENLAAGYGTPAGVVGGWTRSAGHNALILMPEFADAGVGYYAGTGPFPTYWVLMVGK